jgi:hypothetical protein
MRTTARVARDRAFPLLVLAGLLAAGVLAAALIGYASPAATAAQAQYAPQNTAPPAIAGRPQVGQTLQASTGTWTGTPATFAFQWLRCNATGVACSAISGATAGTYVVQAADMGLTLRVQVTATSASGTSEAQSEPTPVPAGQIALPDGTASIPVAGVSPPHRLVATDVRFSPRPLRSRTAPFQIQVRVVDTRGFVVRDALVFVRSTPLVATAPPEAPTGQDGWVTLQSTPRPDFRLVFRRGYNLVHFVRVRKPGDDPLGGVSGRRLVQVPIQP